MDLTDLTDLPTIVPNYGHLLKEVVKSNQMYTYADQSMPLLACLVLC